MTFNVTNAQCINWTETLLLGFTSSSGHRLMVKALQVTLTLDRKRERERAQEEASAPVIVLNKPELDLDTTKLGN